MTMNVEHVLLPNRIYLFIAPKGTAAPADAAIAPGSGWVNCGYTNPDSLGFSTEPEFQQIDTAQADYPILHYQTTEAGNLSIILKQWNAHNIKAAFGGGTITALAGDAGYKYVPPAIGSRVEVSAMTHIEYGTKKFRFVYPRVMQTEGVQLDLHKGAESTLPLSFSVLGSDLVDPWYLLTNSSGFGPA